MTQKSFAGKFHFYFNLVMVLIYAVIGVLLLAVFRFDFLPGTNRIVIGCVLLVYAAYRTYKLVRERKESLAENNSSNAIQ